MGPQVILGTEEQHRELTDVMFHFLDVDRDCPRMANLSWPPPATQGRADKTPGLLTSNCLRSVLHGDMGEKHVRAASKAGGLLEKESTRFTSCYMRAKKPEAAALYPAERSTFPPQSP